MKKILFELKIDDKSDRENIAKGLAAAGYVVQIQKRLKEPVVEFGVIRADHYVVIYEEEAEK